MFNSFICPVCKVVLLSGHLDSWDVGQGAMDDGGGAMISWEVLSLIKDLGNTETNIHINVQHGKTARSLHKLINSPVNDLL